MCLCRLILTKQILFSISRKAVGGTCSTVGQRLDRAVCSALLKLLGGIAGELLRSVCDTLSSNSRILSLREGTWELTEVRYQKMLGMALHWGERFCSYRAKNMLCTRSELVTAIEAKTLLNRMA